MSKEYPRLYETLVRAKAAAKALALSSGENRNEFLKALIGLLESQRGLIAQANLQDLERAKTEGASLTVIDRLALGEKQIGGLIEGLKVCLSFEDPLERTEDYGSPRQGLLVGRKRIPLGLIGFICEARPGAVVEAAAIAVKSGNALLAKPGRESSKTSALLGEIMKKALGAAKLPAEAVTVLAELSHEEIKFMIAQDELLDLVIPRGGQSLIGFVAENSKVPVLKHYKGVNHFYVDKSADLDMAVSLAINGKCNRPSTCNALECLLVHQDLAKEFLPRLCQALIEKGVTIYACARARARVDGLEEAREEHFGKEFLSLEMALKIVDDFDSALEHIAKYGSQHTEAICAQDKEAMVNFLNRVDASCVMVNASTRLNDGGCLGLGAEIGISTSKIHAYGPMGINELTTRKFVVVGQGQLRE
jgi:glutamate-5-semialdehyde dehydrogenase